MNRSGLRRWCWAGAAALGLLATPARAQTRIRIMPPDGAVLAAGQRFDVRVEASGAAAGAPAVLQSVQIDGKDVTRTSAAPAGGADFLLRGFAAARPGAVTIEARTADGARASARLTVEAWGPRGPGPAARNIIFLLGDGMGIAHRTAARLVSRGLRNGKAAGRLAMDTLEVSGMVMTASLNSAITDSSPGMSSYATGQKSNNNQEGVFPDDTIKDAFDNPRIEYLGELLRRTRGPGFQVGIVTTADVTDSTPAANAVHTADRFAGPGIAARYFDERETNAVSVLMGGGSRHFMPKGQGGERPDDRRLADEFAGAGYLRLGSGKDVQQALAARPAPARLLGLFHPSHMVVAFDKVGAGRYSEELALPKNAAYRDTPMLEDMTRLALRSLSAHAPRGFYLLVEGASIDKRAHALDAERTIWDVIEFDRAVQVALDFARGTNSDANPDNDTLVVVTADHECGGLAVIGVGNERFAPPALGRAVRDYAGVFRSRPEQVLELVPNYQPDERGYPRDPDVSRKVLLGWAAGPDHYENWVSNRLQHDAAVASGKPSVAGANAERDGAESSSDNKTTSGRAIPGFLVKGTIENGETPCPGNCPGDTAPVAQTVAGHTATDVPLSASGPGAWQFTGVYENTDVFLKLLRASTGRYPAPPVPPAHGRRR